MLMADHSFDQDEAEGAVVRRKRNVVDLEERVDGLVVGNAVVKFRDMIGG